MANNSITKLPRHTLSKMTGGDNQAIKAFENMEFQTLSLPEQVAYLQAALAMAQNDIIYSTRLANEALDQAQAVTKIHSVDVNEPSVSSKIEPVPFFEEVTADNIEGILPIKSGGTGGSDAATARTNLRIIEFVTTLPNAFEVNKTYGIKNKNGYDFYVAKTNRYAYSTANGDALILNPNTSEVIQILFANGEQGVAFDFNDLSTMFQDASGTIPVTGVGQPVGKVLDKSGRGNHATQLASAKRPILQQNATTGTYYLQFDGVDDFLVTNSIDLSATNKISMFSCIKKVTDVDALIFETSANFNSANGGVSHTQTASKSIGFGVKTNYYATVDYVDEPAPQQAVYSSAIDLALTSKQGIYFRKNGMSQTVTRYEEGDTTGSLGNYPLYIGMRGGAIIPFGGQIYSMIIVSRLTTDLELKNTERAMAKSIEVTL